MDNFSWTRGIHSLVWCILPQIEKKLNNHFLNAEICWRFWLRKSRGFKCLKLETTLWWTQGDTLWQIQAGIPFTKVIEQYFLVHTSSIKQENNPLSIKNVKIRYVWLWVNNFPNSVYAEYLTNTELLIVGVIIKSYLRK